MSWAPFTEAIMASSSESYDGSTHEEVKNLSERQEADEEHADKTDAVSNHARLVGRMRRVYYFLHSTYDELDKDRSGAISAVEMTEMLQKALSQEGLSRIASNIMRITVSELAITRETFVIVALGWIGIDEQFRARGSQGMHSTGMVLICIVWSSVHARTQLTNCVHCTHSLSSSLQVASK
jgi:hypothetical protein